jgi:CRP/FNR family transcriptional regulator, cyclic AMP receptor protein
MTTKQDGVAMLGAVPMFADLTKRDLGRLWEQVKLVDHAPGHQIVGEGRGGHGFHLLVAGSVLVVRKGKKLTLGPGEFFGEMSLIDEGPRTATVTAAEPTTIATLSSAAFRSYAKKHPDLLWKLLVFMTGRLRDEQTVTANLTA